MTKYYDVNTKTFSKFNEAQRNLLNAIYIDPTVYEGTKDAVVYQYHAVQLHLNDFLSEDDVFLVLSEVRKLNDFKVLLYNPVAEIIRLETTLIVDRIESYVNFDNSHNGGGNTKIFTELAISEVSNEIKNRIRKLILDFCEVF